MTFFQLQGRRRILSLRPSKAYSLRELGRIANRYGLQVSTDSSHAAYFRDSAGQVVAAFARIKSFNRRRL
jgi:hypothetical protein